MSGAGITRHWLRRTLSNADAVPRLRKANGGKLPAGEVPSRHPAGGKKAQRTFAAEAYQLANYRSMSALRFK